MLTYKMGGSPNKSVAEPAVGNSHSSLRGKLYREPRVMHIHGTVTINSDNSTHLTEYSHGAGTVLSAFQTFRLILGMPRWHSQLSVGFLVSALVMVSGS